MAMTLTSLTQLEYPQLISMLFMSLPTTALIVLPRLPEQPVPVCRYEPIPQIAVRVMRCPGLLTNFSDDAVHYDAYVVLDADTIVDPGLLQAFARGLAQGAEALQSHNAVLNATDSLALPFAGWPSR